MRSFLDAHRLVQGFAGGSALPFLLGMSGTPDPLLLFVRAAAAARGRAAEPRVLPFNTLTQALRTPPAEPEVLLLCPWDLLPELDWRSGVTRLDLAGDAWRARAAEQLHRITSRGAALLYLPAPTPPCASWPSTDRAIARWLEAELRLAGATILPPEAFALATYLASGCPVGTPHLSLVAEAALDALLPAEPVAKVLVTDLDNTLWSGIVGDDGAAGVSARPEGKGYPHFLLQGLVRALQQDGVLIAAVSKNDAETAREPFRTGSMPLREEHFVAILASWHAKSAQIRELASRLNLGLDAFVFIDDNVLELEEVRRELPAVTTRRFPSEVSALPDFLADLQALFRRRTLSTEDRERTALYRRRLDGMVPQEAAGADLTAFLRELEMTLRITDRSTGDRTRAVQLINKTNQFNLNGERLSDAEVGALLARGGRLLTATLEDRTGSHGEILACLLDGDGVIRSFVLSCRVFQRRVEHAFVAWLATQEPAPTAFAFRRTERNGPLRDFLTRQLDDPAAEAMLLPFDAETLLGEQADTQTLIRLDVATADA